MLSLSASNIGTTPFGSSGGQGPASQAPGSTAAASIATTPITAAPPLPSVVSCTSFIDADGDGARVNGPEPCPWDFPLRDYEIDCDDSDPSRGSPQSFRVDMDGDGYCPLGGTLVCEDDPPPGYCPPEECITVDCNDADGGVQTWMYFDADRDGEGVGERECVADGAEHYAYETYSTDCDDANPEIFTRQDEIAFDDVDSNCDGPEYPVQDYVVPQDVGEIPFAINNSVRCAGVGLSIVGVEIWGDISSSRTIGSGGFVVVGNRGTETAYGGVLTARYLSTSMVSGWEIAPLGPGEVARLGEFQEIGSYSLTLDVPLQNARLPSSMGSDGGEPSDAGAREDEGTELDASASSSQCAPINQEGVIEIPEPRQIRFP